MSSAILTVKNVIKRFSGTVALKGVDMELYPNEILALVGENGAGKSTLMKILSGIYPYGSYEGELLLGDQLCRFQGPADSENAGIAMIYQELNVELDLTVGENILLGRYPRTALGMIDWKKVHQEARKALDMLDVDIDTKVTVRNLSPSMQQLVSIARALWLMRSTYKCDRWKCCKARDRLFVLRYTATSLKKVKVKSAPVTAPEASRAFSAVRVPPCAVTSARASERPMPTPAGMTKAAPSGAGLAPDRFSSRSVDAALPR